LVLDGALMQLAQPRLRKTYWGKQFAIDDAEPLT
jgi:hypothetical protein